MLFRGLFSQIASQTPLHSPPTAATLRSFLPPRLAGRGKYAAGLPPGCLAVPLMELHTFRRCPGCLAVFAQIRTPSAAVLDAWPCSLMELHTFRRCPDAWLCLIYIIMYRPRKARKTRKNKNFSRKSKNFSLFVWWFQNKTVPLHQKSIINRLQ